MIPARPEPVIGFLEGDKLVSTINNFEKFVIVCTHNGVFHFSEVFAYAIIRKLFNCELYRVNSIDDMENFDIAIHLGNRFDYKRGIYSHSSTNLGKYGKYDTTCVGMIYAEYGNLYVDKVIKEWISMQNNTSDAETQAPLNLPGGEKFYYLFYKHFVRKFDAAFIERKINDIAGLVVSYNGPNTNDDFAQLLSFERATLFMQEILEQAVLSKFNNTINIEVMCANMIQEWKENRSIIYKNPNKNLKYCIAKCREKYPGIMKYFAYKRDHNTWIISTTNVRFPESILRKCRAVRDIKIANKKVIKTSRLNFVEQIIEDCLEHDSKSIFVYKKYKN